MIDNSETEETERTDKISSKPKRARNQESNAWIYRMDGNKNIEQGKFPVSVIGQPLERRLPQFIQEFFHHGVFKVDIRNAKGHPEKTFHFEIADNADSEARTVEDASDDEGEENFDFYEPNILQASEDIQALRLQLAIEQERRQRFEAEIKQIRNGSQNETAQLINALEEAHRGKEEMFKLMLQMQSQNAAKPQPDPTAQAMQMMQSAFGMVTQARAISDELAPTESNGGGIIGEAAKLVNALGSNVPAFLPILTGVLGANRTTGQPKARPESPTKKAVTPTASGELSNLAAKIKGKGK